MHYLITGHTGFKGSWLSLLLEMKGHTVSGIGLDPVEKSLYEQANISDLFQKDLRIDIRNRDAIKKAVEQVDPDVVIHLAAQPLVRESYRTPLETFETNVIGTLNVLEATRNLNNLKAALIITTDKVYKNHNKSRGYVETDELGGDDPYSASKAAADIASQSWIKNFSRSPFAIARAGNVIGGGDWAQDRIIPDLVNAYTNNEIPALRYPDAVRPWQHVLDCLNGYLVLIDQQITQGLSGEWNFGPTSGERHSVKDLVDCFAKAWAWDSLPWTVDSRIVEREANLLLLDTTKARTLLNWKDKLNFEESVSWTCNWYRSELTQFERTREQIQQYLNLA